MDGSSRSFLGPQLRLLVALCGCWSIPGQTPSFSTHRVLQNQLRNIGVEEQVCQCASIVRLNLTQWNGVRSWKREFARLLIFKERQGKAIYSRPICTFTIDIRLLRSL